MLEHEWNELEGLCERISDLRHRQSHAFRSRNVGLMEGLREDIARMQRQREQLVKHISARLGAAAAERSPPNNPATRADQPGDPAKVPTRGGDAERQDSSVGTVGYTS